MIWMDEQTFAEISLLTVEVANLAAHLPEVQDLNDAAQQLVRAVALAVNHQAILLKESLYASQAEKDGIIDDRDGRLLT